MVWCGVVWCGVVWCGVVWCGVVWCDVEWCDVWDVSLPNGGCVYTDHTHHPLSQVPTTLDS